MEKKFEIGQRVKMQSATLGEYTFGHVISQDDEYTIVQFDDLEHPTSFTQADVDQLESSQGE